MKSDTPLDRINTICKMWHDKATNETANESAIDYMHGAWIASINVMDDSIDIRAAIDKWQEKCKDRRDEFRGDA